MEYLNNGWLEKNRFIENDWEQPNETELPSFSTSAVQLVNRQAFRLKDSPIDFQKKLDVRAIVINIYLSIESCNTFRARWLTRW